MDRREASGFRSQRLAFIGGGKGDHRRPVREYLELSCIRQLVQIVTADHATRWRVRRTTAHPMNAETLALSSCFHLVRRFGLITAHALHGTDASGNWRGFHKGAGGVTLRAVQASTPARSAQKSSCFVCSSGLRVLRGNALLTCLPSLERDVPASRGRCAHAVAERGRMFGCYPLPGHSVPENHLIVASRRSRYRANGKAPSIPPEG